MNINYDEIIAKANDRAEKLKEIQAFATFAGEKSYALINSLEYFRDLAALMEALDHEGRAMIHQAFTRATRIGSFANTAYTTYTKLNSVNRSDELVLSALVKALK